MKRFILLCMLLAAVSVVPPSTAVSRPLLMAASILDATPRPAGDARGEEAPVPMTDRTPWLVHVILISPGIALAWILFSLARAKRKENGSTPEPKK